ncbi:MAG: DUF5317 domain-containing protein [Chloroflexi bacterium]|nr:DUF5317 domain-containing protein [Chloroflexota bacterium]
MILLFALAAGLLAGFGWARWQNIPYRAPELKHLWLVFIGFLPQLIVIYLPGTRTLLSDRLAAASLLVSQILLLAFALINRRVAGMALLICGVALNMAVMTANGGFMPVSPQTASNLVPENVLQELRPGDRIGPKDILLHPQGTRFEWLADRFLLPGWIPYQAAFSLGDVFIALGVFWLFASPPHSEKIQNRGTQIC